VQQAALNEERNAMTLGSRRLGVAAVSFALATLVGCGSGDGGEQASPTATGLSRTVEEQVERRAVDLGPGLGTGQVEELRCVRSTDQVSSEGNTEWFCSFYAADNGHQWIWEGTVDKDGKLFGSFTRGPDLDPTV
jgi:hypothetical protein